EVRMPEEAKNRDHDQVSDREPVLKPFLVAEPVGDALELQLHEIFCARPAKLRPLFIPEEDIDLKEIEDRRFHAVERCIGPLDCPEASLTVAREQFFACLADILDDGAALEDPDFPIVEAGNLVKGLFAKIFRRTGLAEQANPVIEPRLLECPAGAEV